MSRFHLDPLDMGGGARVLLQSNVAQSTLPSTAVCAVNTAHSLCTSCL